MNKLELNYIDSLLLNFINEQNVNTLVNEEDGTQCTIEDILQQYRNMPDYPNVSILDSSSKILDWITYNSKVNVFLSKLLTLELEIKYYK